MVRSDLGLRATVVLRSLSCERRGATSDLGPERLFLLTSNSFV
jgi:hypothetical protein